MKLDNRTKKAPKDEIDKILAEEVPATTVENEPSGDIKEDLIEKGTEEPEGAEPEIDEETGELKGDKEVPEPEEPEAPIEPEVPEIKPGLPPIEERYKTSSREALILNSKNKKLNDVIDEAENIAEPTDDELRAYVREKGADLEDLDDFTKNTMKTLYMSDYRWKKVAEVRQESKAIDVWAEKVDAFIDSPEVVSELPSIAENAEEFRIYSLKPSRRGADLQTLAGAFLYELEKTTPKKKQGSLLLSQGNGQQAPVAPKGYTIEDLSRLRVADPKKFRDLIKSGKAKSAYDLDTL